MTTPSRSALSAVKRLLNHSWKDIGYDYSRLTDSERVLVSREQMQELVAWIRNSDRTLYERWYVLATHHDPRERIKVTNALFELGVLGQHLMNPEDRARLLADKGIEPPLETPARCPVVPATDTAQQMPAGVRVGERVRIVTCCSGPHKCNRCAFYVGREGILSKIENGEYCVDDLGWVAAVERAEEG